MWWIRVMAVVVTAGAVGVAWCAREDMSRRVTVGGHELRVKEMGEGEVTVVFEIGMGGPLEEWAAVQPGVAKFARTVAYDRLGSRHEGKLLGREVAREVREMLKVIGARPPFVMVGQSMGGVYCRVFADEFPGEVAGLVLVDPTQEAFIRWLERERPELNSFSSEELRGWPEAAGIGETLAEVEGLAVPRVPVAVITGMVRGRDKDRDGMLGRWWGEHEAWVQKLERGRHVAAERAGHGVQVEEPGVVVEEIRRIVNAINISIP